MSRKRQENRIAVFGAIVVIAVAMAISRPGFAQVVAGSVTAASGQVQIVRAGATIAAAPGIAVDVGDRITSGPNSRATLTLNDQSRLEVGPATSITLDQQAAAPGAGPTRVSLFSGVMRSIVTTASGGTPTNYQIHTPNAIAAVRGTRFDTAYSEGSARPGYKGCDKYTDVSVYEGTVNLANIADPNGGQNVPAGYEATVPCQANPTSPGPLSMTGAVSMGTGAGAGGFAAAMPGSGGAPPPACPVCAQPVGSSVTGGGGPPQ